MRLAALSAAFAVMFSSADAFYVPGVAPSDFNWGDPIEIRAIKMTSTHTQLPFEYYSIPFCPPKSGEVQYKSQNLGEILRGDRITNTAYDVHMGTEFECKLLCGSKDKPSVTWDTSESADVYTKIKEEYFVHLITDNLPVATQFRMPENPDEIQYEPGFRLGLVKSGRIAINNHLKLILSYHKYNDGVKESYRVVGFRAETSSLDSDALQIDGSSCSIKQGVSLQPQFVNMDAETNMYFSYSVHWEQSDVRWASRWDSYLAMSDVQIHWFSIINSVVVVFFLSGIIT